jgi:hypothetical protein
VGGPILLVGGPILRTGEGGTVPEPLVRLTELPMERYNPALLNSWTPFGAERVGYTCEFHAVAGDGGRLEP